MISDLGHPAFAAHDVDLTVGFYRMLGIEEAFRAEESSQWRTARSTESGRV